LKAYRSGARENPLMSPMAKPLSDKDIKDVAWYFSKQQGLASKY
jgi:cytochrome c553